jgi:methyl-accepting chemotaxis protein
MAFGLFGKRVPEAAAPVVETRARSAAGNGNTVMMREIDLPVRARGLHRGGFRTACKP